MCGRGVFGRGVFGRGVCGCVVVRVFLGCVYMIGYHKYCSFLKLVQFH